MVVYLPGSEKNGFLPAGFASFYASPIFPFFPNPAGKKTFFPNPAGKLPNPAGKIRTRPGKKPFVIGKLGTHHRNPLLNKYYRHLDVD